MTVQLQRTHSHRTEIRI